jgi:hypothetical protein
VDTIARVRREFYVRGRSIKESGLNNTQAPDLV